MLFRSKEFVRTRTGSVDEAAFKSDLEFIRAMIRFEIDLAIFDTATARRHLLEKDPQAQHALGLFNEAESLLKAPRVNGVKAAR